MTSILLNLCELPTTTLQIAVGFSHHKTLPYIAVWFYLTTPSGNQLPDFSQDLEKISLIGRRARSVPQAFAQFYFPDFDFFALPFSLS
jgi:hypothetical protein